MASQIGKVRTFSSQDEANSPRLVACDKCKVKSVPQGLLTDHAHPSAIKETYCPNCGHVHRAGKDNH